MPSFSVNDLATPRLEALRRQLGPAGRTALARTLADELATQLRLHFAFRDQEGNVHGFPRTHWWLRQARDRTFVRLASDGSASVEVDSAQFAHKVSGGPIYPRPGHRALTIPLDATAAATTPRAVPGLFVYRSTRRGTAFLAAPAPGGSVRCYWRLASSVNQSPDPRALPAADTLRNVLAIRAAAEVARLVADSD